MKGVGFIGSLETKIRKLGAEPDLRLSISEESDSGNSELGDMAFVTIEVTLIFPSNERAALSCRTSASGIENSPLGYSYSERACRTGIVLF